eukprot:TRINITY_DN2490_c0_g3_i1.p1 TRINITY_DN2490_c0_g3~~TRINITY_DN2490_c0_g3_i1.p1  ORF type:complete len:173 (-),score=7.99 TRINITY_DN2490_c0_g3_i1:247-765(-)
MTISDVLSSVSSYIFTKSNQNLLISGAIIFGEIQATPKYDMKWYLQLDKPKWNPPRWVFPAVWTPLKILQTISLWQMLQKGTRDDLILPLSVFGLHLALGTLWNITFFNWHKMKESLGLMAAFWTTLAGSIYTFYQVSNLSAFLLVPTQIWVTIAAKLNYDIVSLNTPKKDV